MIAEVSGSAGLPIVGSSTATLRHQLLRVMPALDVELALPLIEEINQLKRERRAVVLAHNYQTPDIFHGVADIVGDSLALARRSIEVDADCIVMCGVQFMAETTKLMNPARTVLIPDQRAGCSLAESITAADVRALRQRHPGIPVVAYVNTSAEVKAEVDICCTSGNAVEVVESLGVPKVIFVPDRFLGQHVASQTGVELILWDGSCEVHERFSGAEIRQFREDRKGVLVLAHPECPQDVLAEADFVGSTAAMIDAVGQRRPKDVVMITECSMSDNVAIEFPEVNFVRPCNLCPHMKRITLQGIRDCLRDGLHEVQIDPSVAARAQRAVARMLEIGRRKAA